MMKYLTIASDEDDIKLSALIGKDGEGIMPSLVFVHESGNESKDIYWDNPDYIFGDLVKFLDRWTNRSCKKGDKKEFSDIWKLLNEEFVLELSEILKEGITLGWDKTKI
jgi:hypothetical protein